MEKKNNFTQEEIDAAAKVKKLILSKELPESLQAIYMAGEISMFMELNPQPSEQKPTTKISKSDGTGEIEIFQEVKDLAIAWIENYIPHNSIVPEIGQKWKLAEDIQRIVNQSMKQERDRAIQECIEIAWEHDSIQVARELEKLKK